MRRFFVDKINFNNDLITMDGVEHNHLKNVLRMQEGEEVIAVCGDEYDYFCAIEKITKGETTLRITNKEVNIHNPKTNITLYQALTKQDNMSLIVQKLTELGVKNFVPFESQFITSKDKFNKQDKLQMISNQSIKQCKRSTPMVVNKTMSFNEMVASLKEFDIVIFANECEDKINLSQISLDSSLNIAIIIGSEGGFSGEEITKLKELSNVKSVSLGSRILRAETAAIALTSVVMFMVGEWD